MSKAGNEYPDQPVYLCRVDQRIDCLPVYRSLSHNVRKCPMCIADDEYPNQTVYLCRVDLRNDCLPVYMSLSHVSFHYE